MLASASPSYTILADLRTLGATLTPCVTNVTITLPDSVSLPSSLATALQDHQTELLELVETWAERSAIFEYDHGLSRQAADEAAWECLFSLPPFDGKAREASEQGGETEERKSVSTDALEGKNGVSPSVTLRPYQEDAVQALLAAVQRREHPICGMATGAGKSVIIAALCAALPGRTLCVTHRKELLEQNSAELRQWLNDDADIGVYSVGLGQRDTAPRVIFGGVQSVYRRMGRLQEAGLFQTIIIDEVHRVAPPSTTSMYAQIFAACPDATRIGLSATPYRADSGSLHGAEDCWFTTMPVDVGISTLTPEYLAPLTGVLTAKDIDLSKVHTRAGEFIAGEVSQVMSEESVVKAAVEELCELAQHRKKWLVFCVDLAHVAIVTLALCERGIDARAVTGKTSNDERDTNVEAFRAGTFRALVNCEVYTTGFNVPDVDCIVLLRPTLSKGLLTQMIGRGCRQAPGKEDGCLILDYSGNLQRHAPLDAIPVLTKSPRRQAAERQEREWVQIERERQAKHAHSVLQPAAQTYRVTGMAYQVLPAKKRPGKKLLCVRYHCAGREPVTTWLCVEYEGWARLQAQAWFGRRGSACPATAQAGRRVAEGLPVPSEILVQPDGRWDRVLLEYFDAEG